MMRYIYKNAFEKRDPCQFVFEHFKSVRYLVVQAKSDLANAEMVAIHDPKNHLLTVTNKNGDVIRRYVIEYIKSNRATGYQVHPIWLRPDGSEGCYITKDRTNIKT